MVTLSFVVLVALGYVGYTFIRTSERSDADKVCTTFVTSIDRESLESSLSLLQRYAAGSIDVYDTDGSRDYVLDAIRVSVAFDRQAARLLADLSEFRFAEGLPKRDLLRSTSDAYSIYAFSKEAYSIALADATSATPSATADDDLTEAAESLDGDVTNLSDWFQKFRYSSYDVSSMDACSVAFDLMNLPVRSG